MLALRHKRKFEPQNVSSALPPIADMCGAARDVRFGPKADICKGRQIAVTQRREDAMKDFNSRLAVPEMSAVSDILPS